MYDNEIFSYEENTNIILPEDSQHNLIELSNNGELLAI